MDIERWLKFVATTNGRDKVYRVIQYASRLLAIYLLKNNNKNDNAKRLIQLSMAMGQGRKLFRMGKPMDHLWLMYKVLANGRRTYGKDDVARNLLITKCLGFAGWLLLDSIQWLNIMKVWQPTSAMPLVNDLAPRLWLTGLIANFLLNLYHLEATVKEHLHDDDGRGNLWTKVIKDKGVQKLAFDATQDLIDMTIPASLAGLLDISPAMVALCGTVTSLMGARTVWLSC